MEKGYINHDTLLFLKYLEIAKCCNPIRYIREVKICWSMHYCLAVIKYHIHVIVVCQRMNIYYILIVWSNA